MVLVIQLSMIGTERGMADSHNLAEILLLGTAEEAAIVIFFTMISKVMRIAGKVNTGQMDPDILIPMRVGIILLQIEDLMKLAFIMQREGVEWENHASMCIMTILMGLIKFRQMNHLGKGKLIEGT